jgi:broad specificity phosphatase PhoE
MTEITLLRHGQASFGSANYDQLSELGTQQAIWLGEHYKELQNNFDRIVIGGMQRHRQTAEGFLQGLAADQPPSLECHDGFNEYSFSGLLKPIQQHYADRLHASDHAKRDYYHNIKLALTLWMDGSIRDDGQDSWESFCQRIYAGFDFACDTPAKRILIVTSGGPIAVIVARLLKLDPATTVDLTLQCKNSSCTTILSNGREFTLNNFNNISHLMTADHQHGITYA